MEPHEDQSGKIPTAGPDADGSLGALVLGRARGPMLGTIPTDLATMVPLVRGPAVSGWASDDSRLDNHGWMGQLDAQRQPAKDRPGVMPGRSSSSRLGGSAVCAFDQRGGRALGDSDHQRSRYFADGVARSRSRFMLCICSAQHSMRCKPMQPIHEVTDFIHIDTCTRSDNRLTSSCALATQN